MTPIPTEYHGYRFRSRLEARWVVFFESLKIEFIYEPEGFRLPDGTCYLPDFWLPQVRFWAEVKPSALFIEESYKAAALVRNSRRNLILLVGQPDFRNYTGMTWDAGEVTESEYWLDIYQSRYYWRENRLFSCPAEPLTEAIATKEYRQAVYASRGARFEGAA